MNTASEFEHAVARFIEGYGVRQVVAGVSGGADSVALLHVLQALGIKCTAVHCNFHLRGKESDRDQLFVQELCDRLGISLEICHYSTSDYASEHGISIEMAARELRYRDFERIMQETGSDAICVAHHRDDSVETLLMNLMRGTGIRGLTGIRPLNGHILRPLLCMSRADIEAYLAAIGQPFVTDSTNLETDYTRNRVRLQLLPLMRSICPGADRAVADTAVHMQQALAIYEKAVREESARITSTHDGILSIDIDALKGCTAPETMLYEILSPYGFNATQSDDLFRALDAAPGRMFRSATHTAVKDRGTVEVCASQEPFMKTVSTACDSVTELAGGRRLIIAHPGPDEPVSRDPHVATLDADLAGPELTVRSWQTGDRFVPFGMKGSRLVSDYMTDLKFSLTRKQSQLVVCSGNDIVWVVGLRSDNRYRVTDRTLHRITITLE